MAGSLRKLEPFQMAQVKIRNGFWASRLETNSRATIPHAYDRCKESGRTDAFKMDWKPGRGSQPHIFWDSDVAKWIEAASYSLMTHPTPELERTLDGVVNLVAGAQQPDGYLNVHFTVVEPEKRWTNLRDWHELYCAGHLMEAAVAHWRATGSRRLLDAARRYADYIDSVFGPGKHTGYPGHEEIELALVKLWRATGESRYLELSRYFIEERGRQPHLFDAEAAARGEEPGGHRAAYEQYQAHLPVRQQDEAVGHAVRAMYLYSGMADVAAETGDAELLAACERLWESATARKMYITGGVGSLHRGEAFGPDFYLPNESAYAETCAAIGLVLFAHRMLQFDGDGRYADVMERALYNSVLSGVSLDGRKFFYVNPLSSSGSHHRQKWFACACCPTNIARLLASLGLYVYSASDRAVYIHLYVGSKGEVQVVGAQLTLMQETRYPWDGEVAISVGLDRPAEFDVMLRIPGWCSRHEVKVNGVLADAPVRRGYARLRQRWSDGDRIELSLAMPVERMVSCPSVAENAGRVALQRGPLVYCLEQCDHAALVRSIVLPDDASLTVRFDPAFGGGMMLIEGQGVAPRSGRKHEPLYRPAREQGYEKIDIRAVPYFAWDNRQPGPMTVWMPRTEGNVAAF